MSAYHFDSWDWISAEKTEVFYNPPGQTSKSFDIEEIIDRAKSNQTLKLTIKNCHITNLPESIGELIDLQALFLEGNNLKELPESIYRLTNLNCLSLSDNKLVSLSENICKLTKLVHLDLSNNQLSSLPIGIGQISPWELNLRNNPLTDLSSLKGQHHLSSIQFLVDRLYPRYWTKLSDWKSEWLLDEENAEIRRRIIEELGYEKICDELKALTLDSWREYNLLRIGGVDAIFSIQEDELDPLPEVLYREPMILLKMTCPSTNHIHILRVPPEITSAEAAITWVNHGVHPDRIAFAT
jgi:hypothetical protein